MDVVQLLGTNVRRYRKLKGMSQEELSLEAGMKRSYVSDLERGTRNPSVRALGRLAQALGVKPSEMLEGSDAEHPSKVKCVNNDN
jgi:transcriptional regulator with XRE-family HTH domain